MTLGMISWENMSLLGPQGPVNWHWDLCQTGANGNDDASNFFQCLQTKFTTPEEIFGPLLSKLLENDKCKQCKAVFYPQ